MRKTFLIPFFVFSLLASTCFGAEKPNLKEVTISAGESVSSVLDITNITPGGGSLFSLYMPSAWTTAVVTVLVSPTCAAPWYNAYDASGNEYTLAVGTSRYVGLDPAYFVGTRCVKFVSGTSSAAVNQAANRVIRIGYGRYGQ